MATNSEGTSRRSFLKSSGLVAASALVAGTLPARESPTSLVAGEQFDSTVHLIRPEDQLVLQVEAPSMSGIAGDAFEVFKQNGTYFLRPKPTATQPLLRVSMATQHTMEWAVASTASAVRPTQPIHSLPTDLLFHVPQGVAIPLTTAGMLAALRDLPLATHSKAGTVDEVEQIAPVGAAALLRAAMAPLLHPDAPYSDVFAADARMRGAAALSQRAELSSAAPVSDANFPSEASVRLLISSRLIITPPGGATRFDHAVAPVTREALTEMWHTRLTVKTTTGSRVQSTLAARAFFALEGVGTGTWLTDVDGSKMSALSSTKAKAIVTQNGTIDPQDPEASALMMSRLALSPRMGASTRLQGKWNHQPGAIVKSFSHTTSSGRDVFARNAVTGTLYPLGHKAVQTETVERVFRGEYGSYLGVLTKSVRVNVVQPEKKYGSRMWPFSRVEVVDDTPSVDTVQYLVGGAGNPNNSASYLHQGGLPYRYKCRGIDHAGNPVDFDMPLVFVPDGFSAYPTLAANYAATLNDTNPLKRLPNVHLGHVAVAAPGEVPGATEVVGDATLAAPQTSTDLPAVLHYRGRIPALGHLTDQASMVINYAEPFKLDGFGDENEGEVVLALGSTLGVGLTDAASVGGLFSPMSMEITGMSRKIGAVAGPLSDVAGNDFKPENFLGQELLGQLNLFGIFPLGQLIAKSADLSQAPKIAAAAADGLRSQSFRWSVPLFAQPDQQELTFGGAKLRPIGNPAPILTIESVLSIGDDDQPHQHTTFRAEHVLFAFGLPGLGEVLRLPLHTVEFTTIDTQKPHVDIDLGAIQFDGVLAFVGRLAALINPGGFSGARAIGARSETPGSGPSVEVTAAGVRSAFSLAIPSVAIGAFSLENITFGAALTLPFSGIPRFDFNFATPDNPFRLIVACLGGGGYLSLGMNAKDGLDTLQGALEFGAQLKIDLGVISGKVSAMGGIFFKIENGETTLTGYLTLHGEVSILSIITMGMITTLSLTYQGKKVRGEAELVFYVSTFFFSTTVRRTFKRKFAGSNGDPTFAQLMAPANFNGDRPWDTYCRAFI